MPGYVVATFARCEACLLPRRVVVVPDDLDGTVTFRHRDVLLVADQGSAKANRSAACRGVACPRAGR